MLWDTSDKSAAVSPDQSRTTPAGFAVRTTLVGCCRFLWPLRLSFMLPRRYRDCYSSWRWIQVWILCWFFRILCIKTPQPADICTTYQNIWPIPTVMGLYRCISLTIWTDSSGNLCPDEWRTRILHSLGSGGKFSSLCLWVMLWEG